MRTTLITTAIALLSIYGISQFTTSTAPRMLSSEEQAIHTAWNQWKMTNGKSYGNVAENNYRAKVFRQNYFKVKEHNSTPGITSTLTLNKFADLDSVEFKKQYASALLPKRNHKQKKAKIVSDTVIPTSKDWREDNKIAAVKDQGQCGSCWAFSANGAVEGRNSIKNNLSGSTIKTLSEQELVDCAGGDYFNQGCNGGLMDYAFEYIKDHGIAGDSAYEYTAMDGTCKRSLYSREVNLTSFEDVDDGDVEKLKEAIAEGPVSVAIEADSYVFQLYSSGVLTTPHVVQV